MVRKPGGLIACCLQYGHVRTRVTADYAGQAESGWLDDLAVERLEMVIDQIETIWRPSTPASTSAARPPTSTGAALRGRHRSPDEW